MGRREEVDMMMRKPFVSPPETVSCSLCQLQVPHAEALSVEGQEYLYYFCGLGCYEAWRQDGGYPGASREEPG